MSEREDEIPEPTARLSGAIYDVLRETARKMIGAADRRGALRATEIVHEAFLKLAASGTTFESERHYRIVAAKAFRQIIIDHARKQGALKRRAERDAWTLDTTLIGPSERTHDAIEVHEALEQLEQEDSRAGRVVELRFFGGLGHADIAEHLDVSLATVERDWRYARAFLYKSLSPETHA
ncbi:MAG: ECF-type sigma factor [Planctomycetota bacterium]